MDAKKPTCTAEALPGYIWDTNQWRRRRPHEYQRGVAKRIPSVGQSPPRAAYGSTTRSPAAPSAGRGFLADAQDYAPSREEDLAGLIRRWPQAVADFLEHRGISEQDLRDHIDDLLDRASGIVG
mgnify:CR=1 FL=1